jgi:hypothetical protein
LGPDIVTSYKGDVEVVIIGVAVANPLPNAQVTSNAAIAAKIFFMILPPPGRCLAKNLNPGVAQPFAKQVAPFLWPKDLAFQEKTRKKVHLSDLQVRFEVNINVQIKSRLKPLFQLDITLYIIINFLSRVYNISFIKDLLV